MQKTIALICYIIFVNCNDIDNNSIIPMETVPYVDIERFMGDWFVIANIPTFIEKDATNAIESYKLNQKGEIETIFTFYKNSPDGEKKVYKPKGFIYNSETNAEWRMQFIWPFKMPFLIIDLADDYSHTVIGYPSRDYVWIMARNPVISEDIYIEIIEKLKNINYDISAIQKVPQIWEN
tara:strand:+ start:1218 stop:1754 length:537 start_codon:yes stop_codon:yes gene_type:complete